MLKKSTNLVEVGGNPPELDEVVLLELLGEGDVVKVVECVDGGLEAVVVLLIDQEPVQGLVHGFVVQVLHGAQVRLDQLQVINLKERV